ncbi:MAG TPA: hypothetical protein VFP35_02135 [Candidatus Saccharimonadales bacterium]|nr:hypothetical protein [Candidatus Saccharimonadales bacterium]
MANQNSKNTSISWTASEFIDHPRGPAWYLGLAVSVAVLAALVYFISKDIFGAVVIIIAGAIVGSVAHWKPQQINYELSAQGLKAGQKFYPLSQFKTFSIIREGDLTSLVLDPLKRFMPAVSAYFDESDEDRIVAIIGDHLPIKNRRADSIDRLSRRLRF